MEKVVLVGAGQHSRVVLYNLKEQGIYEPICLIDANKNLWNKKIGGVYVAPGFTNLDQEYLHDLKDKYGTNKFFICIGSMKVRKKFYDFFVNNGWEAVNIFHPDAVISRTAEIGKGVLIECGCLITPSPLIGNNVVVNTGSQVNHDNIVEDHVYIASGVILSGGVKIGENTLIDDGVIITLGREVGKNCIIGAGAVVTKNIPDNSVAYGVPCQVVRDNIQ